MRSSLYHKLCSRIRREGPLSIATYMDMCLYDEHDGFYTTTPELTDHFLTAPEISPLFAEMLAIYFILQWEKCGKPSSVAVIELGPGHGTLAQELSKLLFQYMGKDTRLSYVLVEQSPTLKKRQMEVLKNAPYPVFWADWQQAQALSYTSECLFVVANEFFDALPIHQYEKRGEDWQERCITCDPDGQLSFTHTSPLWVQPPAFPKVGGFYEYSPQAHQWFGYILSALSQQLGAAVIIDYGYSAPEEGYQDTLQAIHKHQMVNVLEKVGAADLTAHVDFEALLRQAARFPVTTQLLFQRDFLLSYGLMLRLERLLVDRPIADRHSLIQGAQRLVSPEQMGTLFKVLLCQRP